MQEQRYTEKDWKLLRSKIAGWQEAYMDSPSDKFWELEQRIGEDKKKTGEIARMSRSKLIDNLISLINEDAICFEDFEGFSDGLKAAVQAFTGR
jgi:hypothetical protein